MEREIYETLNALYSWFYIKYKNHIAYESKRVYLWTVAYYCVFPSKMIRQSENSSQTPTLAHLKWTDRGEQKEGGKNR